MSSIGLNLGLSSITHMRIRRESCEEIKKDQTHGHAQSTIDQQYTVFKVYRHLYETCLTAKRVNMFVFCSVCWFDIVCVCSVVSP